jgi:hypothetical protein
MVVQLGLVFLLQFPELFAESVVLLLQSLHETTRTFSLMLLLYNNYHVRRSTRPLRSLLRNVSRASSSSLQKLSLIVDPKPPPLHRIVDAALDNCFHPDPAPPHPIDREAMGTPSRAEFFSVLRKGLTRYLKVRSNLLRFP